MKVIIITGTPATGKTTLAQLLAPQLNFKYLNLAPLLKRLSEGYDRQKQCLIIDLKKLKKEIIKIIKKEKHNLLISSHLIHHLPKKYVSLCLVTKCSDLKKLKQRLKKRRYPQKKVEENLQCEIFDICLAEAQARKHKILIVDTSKKINQQKLIKKIKNMIKPDE